MSGPRARDVRLIIAAAAISMLLSAVCCVMAVMNLAGAAGALHPRRTPRWPYAAPNTAAAR